MFYWLNPKDTERHLESNNFWTSIFEVNWPIKPGENQGNDVRLGVQVVEVLNVWRRRIESIHASIYPFSYIGLYIFVWNRSIQQHNIHGYTNPDTHMYIFMHMVLDIFIQIPHSSDSQCQINTYHIWINQSWWWTLTWKARPFEDSYSKKESRHSVVTWCLEVFIIHPCKHTHLYIYIYILHT